MKIEQRREVLDIKKIVLQFFEPIFDPGNGVFNVACDFDCRLTVTKPISVVRLRPMATVQALSHISPLVSLGVRPVRRQVRCDGVDLFFKSFFNAPAFQAASDAPQQRVGAF